MHSTPVKIALTLVNHFIMETLQIGLVFLNSFPFPIFLRSQSSVSKPNLCSFLNIFFSCFNWIIHWPRSSATKANKKVGNLQGVHLTGDTKNPCRENKTGDVTLLIWGSGEEKRKSSPQFPRWRDESTQCTTVERRIPSMYHR